MSRSPSSAPGRLEDRPDIALPRPSSVIRPAPCRQIRIARRKRSKVVRPDHQLRRLPHAPHIQRPMESPRKTPRPRRANFPSKNPILVRLCPRRMPRVKLRRRRLRREPANRLRQLPVQRPHKIFRRNRRAQNRTKPPAPARGRPRRSARCPAAAPVRRSPARSLRPAFPGSSPDPAAPASHKNPCRRRPASASSSSRVRSPCSAAIS